MDLIQVHLDGFSKFSLYKGSVGFHFCPAFEESLGCTTCPCPEQHLIIYGGRHTQSSVKRLTLWQQKSVWPETARVYDKRV